MIFSVDCDYCKVDFNRKKLQFCLSQMKKWKHCCFLAVKIVLSIPDAEPLPLKGVRSSYRWSKIQVAFV